MHEAEFDTIMTWLDRPSYAQLKQLVAKEGAEGLRKAIDATKRAAKVWMTRNHPDRGGDTTQTAQVNEAIRIMSAMSVRVRPAPIRAAPTIDVWNPNRWPWDG